ncbi:MAG: DnaJ C-terminal domain-containing protein, partial [Nostocoides sp.]
AGEGEVGPGGGPPGDLYVEVKVRPHHLFSRRGDDLHATLEIPMTAAALGTTIDLATFDGSRPVDVTTGTQSGETKTLRGLGVTHLRGGGRGDVIVHMAVSTPRGLDGRQEDLLRQLAVARGEERPAGRVTAADQGLLGKLRDAFKGH